MNYKVIMLDFDGTTACTVHAIYHAAKRMLNEYGYEVEKDIVYKNFGLALPYSFYCFAGVESFDEATSKQMIADYNRIYQAEAEQLIELFDGVADTLDTLKKAGVKIVIASNNIHPVLERQLANLGIRQYIDDIVAVEDVENVKIWDARLVATFVVYRMAVTRQRCSARRVQNILWTTSRSW